jgi:gliding motility-associated-like protein
MIKIKFLIVSLLISFAGFSQILTPFEGFESATFPPTTPANWAVFDNGISAGGINNKNWVAVTTSALVNEGLKSAYMDGRQQIGAGNTARDFLASPAVTVATNGQLKFFTRTNTPTPIGTNLQIRVKLVSAGPQNDPNGYEIIREWNNGSVPPLTAIFNVYEEKTIDFNLTPQYQNVPVYIAFCLENFQEGATTTANRWLVDQVRIVTLCNAPAATSLTATSILSSSATLGWAAASGSIGYEIENQLSTVPFTGIATGNSTTNNFSQIGLTSLTCYHFRVRTSCGNGNFSAWSGDFQYCTAAAPPVCGGNFVDSGGVNGNYSNNQNITNTINPTIAGQQVTVTFTTFSTELGDDLLRIYDGNSVATGTLLGTFSGNANPGSFTGTTTSGALTFVFTSNPFGTEAGWTSNITCGPPPNCTVPNLLNVINILPTVATIGWSQSPNPNATTSNEWEYLILPSPSVIPTNTTVGIFTNTNSLQATNLLPDTCYDLYVRAICSTSEFSKWSNPKNFCTPIAPPICGGQFVDTGGVVNSYSSNENYTVTICPQTPGDQVTVTFISFNTEASFDGLYIFDGNSITSPQISSNNVPGNGDLTLPGAYWGSVNLGSFTSSSPDGCLTFKFISDGFSNSDGWVSNITCAPAPACATPTSLSVSTILSTKATINWLQPANPNGTTANQWEYVVVPSPSTPPTNTSVGILTSDLSNTIIDLNPQTCYDFYVRAVCSATEKSIWKGPINFCTTIAPPVCGGLFLDEGGLANDYPNNSNSTVTICPINIGDVVTVTFTSFNTEATYDGLYVYDGDSVNALNQISSENNGGNVPGNLPGSFWGNSIPGPFVSSTADGCLTFKFISDGFVNLSGWEANVTCAPRPTCSTPKNLSVTSITPTNASVSWLQPLNPDNSVATSWEYIILPSPSTPPLNSTIGTTTSNPKNFNDLLSNTCYDFYVRAICTSTDFSNWSIPKTFCTLIAPPVCGGLFVDNGGANNNYLEDSDVVTTICPNNPGDVVTVTFTSFNTESTYDGLYVYSGNAVNALNQISSVNNGGNVPGNLSGSFWGTTIPGPFSSTDNNGCLTFRFRSDPSVQRPGWVANVTCAPAPTCSRPNLLTVSNTTLTTASLGWSQPENPSIYAIVNDSFTFKAVDNNGGISSDASFIIPLGYVSTNIKPLANNANNLNIALTAGATAINPLTATDSDGTILAFKIVALPTLGNLFVNGTAVVLNQNLNLTEVASLTYDPIGINSGYDTIKFTAIDNDNDSSLIATLTIPVGITDVNILPVSTNFINANIPSNSGITPISAIAATDQNGTIQSYTITSLPALGILYVGNVAVTLNQSLSLTQISTLKYDPTGSTANAWEYLILPANSAFPLATATGFIATSNSTNNIAVGLNNSTCYDYYVRAVCSSTDSSLWSGPKSFCTLIPNDECASPTIVLTNPNQTCVNFAAGTFNGATASTQVNLCSNDTNKDIWYQFVATSANHSIRLINVVGGNAFSLNYAVYSGNDCNNLTQISCITGVLGVVNNLVIGQTYTVRVFIDSFVTNSNITFDICIGTVLPSITSNTTQYTPEQLVQNVLLNSTCANVSNVTSFTESNGIGYFNQNGSTFPFSDGIILSTGDVNNAKGPNLTTLSDGNGGDSTDADLEAIVLAGTGTAMVSRNVTKLEFDFTPITNNISFDFLFASEEYGTFQCDFSDAFAFLLTNLSTGVTTNLAIVPGTTTPISVVTIRDGLYNNNCDSQNPTFFGQFNNQPPATGVSPLSAPINFNGQTVPLVATSPVTINQPYHIKLVVADRLDTAFDSAVFLKGSSFGIGNLNVGSNLLQSNGTALCFGETQTINSQLDPALYTFEWTKDGQVLTGQNNANLVINAAGTYTVNVVYIGSNCTGTDTVIVEYYPEVIPGNPATLFACNSTGFGTFNLTQNNPALLSGLGSGYTIKYYLNANDANLDQNAITNISAFQNTTNPQNICARVQNTFSGCFGVKCFNLNVQDLTPQFTTPATLVLCNGTSGTISVSAINFPLADATYSWKKDGVNLTNTTSSITVSQIGDYQVTVNYSGCIASRTTTVTFGNIVANTSPNITICDNYVLPVLSANNNYFSGVNGSGTAYFAGNIVSASVLPMYIYAQLGACSDQSSFNINIIPNTIANATFSYVSPVCKNATSNPTPILTSNFVTGGVYSCLNSNLILNSATGEIDILSPVGTYDVKYTAPANSSQCVLANSFSTQIIIKDIETPIVGFSYNAVYCKSDVVANPTKVTGFVNGGTFSASDGRFINATTGDFNVATFGVGTFTITYNLPANPANCVLSNSSTFQVTIKDLITPTFAPVTFCQNEEILLPTASNNITPIIGSWNLAALSTANAGLVTNAVFTPDSGQCANIGSVVIKVNPSPVFEIVGNCISSDFTLQVVPELNNASYQWFKTGTSIALNSTNSKAIVKEIGDYYCIATVNGCPTKIDFNVTNTICDIQKGISPNSDGFNDYFDLSTLNVQKLEIYNRYGAKVYSLSNYTNQWNGKTDDNKILPDGTYYYVAELGDGNTKTGWVYINKEIK